MTCSRINIFRVLASSRVRGTSFDIKIRNKFIEIKYSSPNRFIIFITNDWYFSLASASGLSLVDVEKLTEGFQVLDRMFSQV